MTFEEWWEEWGREDPGIREKVSRGWAEFIWNASIANMVEPEPEDPTPTEMLKKLIELGWTIQLDWDRTIQLYEPNGNHYGPWPKSAYRKAFPKKVKREVEVYQSPDGRVRDYRYYREIPQGDITLPWTKGTATFLVPEEE